MVERRRAQDETLILIRVRNGDVDTPTARQRIGNEVQSSHRECAGGQRCLQSQRGIAQHRWGAVAVTSGAVVRARATPDGRHTR